LAANPGTEAGGSRKKKNGTGEKDKKAQRGRTTKKEKGDHPRNACQHGKRYCPRTERLRK